MSNHDPYSDLDLVARESDILPKQRWDAVNSQMPSKVLWGEGPRLAWDDEMIWG